MCYVLLKEKKDMAILIGDYVLWKEKNWDVHLVVLNIGHLPHSNHCSIGFYQ